MLSTAPLLSRTLVSSDKRVYPCSAPCFWFTRVSGITVHCQCHIACNVRPRSLLLCYVLCSSTIAVFVLLYLKKLPTHLLCEILFAFAQQRCIRLLLHIQLDFLSIAVGVGGCSSTRAEGDRSLLWRQFYKAHAKPKIRISIKTVLHVKI